MIIVEGKKSFYLGTTATLIEDTRELAWAERSVNPNPALKYVLGRYVQANTPNDNKQYWTLEDLQAAQKTIHYSPLNLLHRVDAVCGAFVDSEMVYPVEAASGDSGEPYIETLAAFWKYYYPNELKIIEAAHANGSLALSMECVSESITCFGEAGCGKEYAYNGPKSLSYCSHLNDGSSVKQLNKPHFLAGALIFPPEKPGWKGAAVTDLSSLIKEYEKECEMAYEGIKQETPHLDPATWEFLMQQLVSRATHRERRIESKYQARKIRQDKLADKKQVRAAKKS